MEIREALHHWLMIAIFTDQFFYLFPSVVLWLVVVFHSLCINKPMLVNFYSFELLILMEVPVVYALLASISNS